MLLCCVMMQRSVARYTTADAALCCFYGACVGRVSTLDERPVIVPLYYPGGILSGRKISRGDNSFCHAFSLSKSLFNFESRTFYEDSSLLTIAI